MGRITTPREGSRAQAWTPGRPIPAPLRLHEADVVPEWADYNGHMSESCYLLVFGDGADAFFRFFGVDEDYRASGRSLFTAETHLRHVREARVGDRLRLTLQVLGVDAKRLHIVHEMLDDTGRVVSTAEQLLLHVDTRAGRVAPFPREIFARLGEIRAAHGALPVPAYVGRVIQIPASPAAPPTPPAPATPAAPSTPPASAAPAAPSTPPASAAPAAPSTPVAPPSPPCPPVRTDERG